MSRLAGSTAMSCACRLVPLSEKSARSGQLSQRVLKLQYSLGLGLRCDYLETRLSLRSPRPRVATGMFNGVHADAALNSSGSAIKSKLTI